MRVVVVLWLESAAGDRDKKCIKKSQLLDLVLTFCLNLSIVFSKNKQTTKNPTKTTTKENP